MTDLKNELIDSWFQIGFSDAENVMAAKLGDQEEYIKLLGEAKVKAFRWYGVNTHVSQQW